MVYFSLVRESYKPVQKHWTSDGIGLEKNLALLNMQISETQGFFDIWKSKLEQLEWRGCSLELVEYALLALVICAAW